MKEKGKVMTGLVCSVRRHDILSERNVELLGVGRWGIPRSSQVVCPKNSEYS